MKHDGEFSVTRADAWSRDFHRRFGAHAIWLYAGLAVVNAGVAIALEIVAGASFINAPVAEIVPIGAAALGVGAVCIVLAAVTALRDLAPGFRWMTSRRDPADAPEAWDSAVNGVTRVLIKGAGMFAVGYIPVAAFTVVHLDRESYDFLTVYSYFLIGIGFATSLDYFTFRWLLRPVVRDVADRLPTAHNVHVARPSLRARLLLITIVVSTTVGLVTASIASTISEGTTRFPASVAIVVVIVTVVGLPPVVLLADDISRPFRELIQASRRAEAGDLSARVPILGADEGGVMAAQFNSMLRGMQERQALREAVDSYVHPVVAERLISEGQLLSGQAVTGTVLFVDIRGFTQWCERHAANDAVDLLNRFFSLIVPIIEDNGGHTNKFLGDGLLAGFGAPIAYDDHAVRAVRAAQEIVAGVEEHFEGVLEVGVGINTGEFIVGTVGGGGHLEYALIGDVVNVASRLEQLTKDTGDAVLMGESTVQALGLDAGDVVERGGVAVRGRRERVSVFALAGGVSSPLRP